MGGCVCAYTYMKRKITLAIKYNVCRKDIKNVSARIEWHSNMACQACAIIFMIKGLIAELKQNIMLLPFSICAVLRIENSFLGNRQVIERSSVTFMGKNWNFCKNKASFQSPLLTHIFHIKNIIVSLSNLINSPQLSSRDRFLSLPQDKKKLKDHHFKTVTIL